MLVHLDLFSGIGGFALACEWAGIETIGFVEIDKYCQKVLRKNFPGVPIVEDIRDVGRIKEIVANANGRLQEQSQGQIQTRGDIANGISAQGIRNRAEGNREGRQSPAILITGGFPCQPFSVAGKRRGTADNRYLWNEMFAVIKAIKPAWVLAENVAGIAGMEFTDSVSGLESEVPEEVEAELSAVLDRVCADLEEVGYEVQPIIIPACAVNAWHRRDRIWIVAYNKCLGWETRVEQRIQSKEQVAKGQNAINIQPSIPDTTEQRLYSKENIGIMEGTGSDKLYPSQSRDYRNNWWAVEPELGRVAHGIPARVDRLKCLGNAIVPQVAYEIIRVIKEMEI